MENSSEQWLPVVGYEGLYEVSNLGRVKRIAAGRGAVPGIRKQTTHPSGYKIVSLSRDNIQQNHRVHSLVLEAFIGPRPDGMEGCHTNDIPGDNRLENLRWDTHRANIADRTRNNHPRKASPRRTHCPNGHEYVNGSFLVTRKGHRNCLHCLTAKEARRTINRRQHYSRKDLISVCKNGHPRSATNQYISPKGKRECRDCRKVQDQMRSATRGVKHGKAF